MTTQTPKERVLDTAGTLFYRDGFLAVGVDTIVRESGVAKMTLYRHFASKDDLIVAYLERSNEQFWAWFDSKLGHGNARDQIHALFDAVGELADAPSCAGCPFQHAANDFPASHPAHVIAHQHKRVVIQRLSDLCAEAGLADADALGAQLLLLMDGAFIAARMFPPGANPAAQVGAAARSLLRAHASSA